MAAEAVQTFDFVCQAGRGVCPFHFYDVSRADLFAAAAFFALSGIKMRRLGKNLRSQKVNNSRHLIR